MCCCCILALMPICFCRTKGHIKIFWPETILVIFLHMMELLYKVIINHIRANLFFTSPTQKVFFEEISNITYRLLFPLVEHNKCQEQKVNYCKNLFGLISGLGPLSCQAFDFQNCQQDALLRFVSQRDWPSRYTTQSPLTVMEHTSLSHFVCQQTCEFLIERIQKTEVQNLRDFYTYWYQNNDFLQVNNSRKQGWMGWIQSHLTHWVFPKKPIGKKPQFCPFLGFSI